LRRCCVPAFLAGLVILVGGGPLERAAAQESAIARSDITTVFGYYGVTNGHSGRRFASAWGNAYFQNGLGTHAEAHFMDREETAGYLAGGLSWNGDFAEMRGWLGTSTENDGILPELHARIEAVYRSRAELGFVISPALIHRSFRNGAEESAAEIQITKYTPFYAGSLIMSVIGRATLTDPGRHASAAFGAGLTYAEFQKFSIGLTVEGGRAAYDGLLAPGMLDERYFSIRPLASLFLAKDIELFGMMEYSGRESYSIFGGHLGVKVYFD